MGLPRQIGLYATFLAKRRIGLNKRHKKVAHFANPRSGDEVLDLGSASFGITKELAGMCRRVVGGDIDPDMVALGRFSFPQLDIRLLDARRTGLDDGSFDLVLLSLILHHLEPQDVEGAVREACRLARRDVVVVELPQEDPESLLQRGILYVAERSRLERFRGLDFVSPFQDEGFEMVQHGKGSGLFEGYRFRRMGVY